MKRVLQMSVGLVLACLLAGTALAQDSGKNDSKSSKKEAGLGEVGAMLMKLDTNQDGKLSKDEMQRVSAKFPEDRFSALDTDGDGFLTPEEVQSGVSKLANSPEAGQMLKKLDTNQDGNLSREETARFAAFFTKERFDNLDTNGDGQLSPEELRAAATKGTEESEEAKMLRRADKNGDKKVTKEEFAREFPNAPAEYFAKLDSNSDGVLDVKDMPEAPKAPAAAGLLAGVDTDGDGTVTYAELAAARPGITQDMFNRLDQNGDGVLSSADRGDRLRQLRERRQGRSNTND